MPVHEPMKTLGFWRGQKGSGDTEFPFHITKGEGTQNFREKGGGGGMKPSGSKWSRTLWRAAYVL